MKNLFFIIVVFTTIGCSVTPEKKAQKIIKEYLKENLDNWNSYESVSFGKLDSLFSKITDDEKYVKITSDILQWSQDYNYVDNYMNGKVAYYDKQEFHKGLRAADSIKKYLPIHDSLENNFRPKHIGWKMPHSYRSTNPIGAIIIHKDTFYFDFGINKIAHNTINK
jgi:hypothetical protein